jgi:hypothetical protein
MASDLLELGIEGIDKLVDKHFHKVPDKYVNPHTYHVHRRRHRHEKTRDDKEESSSGDSDVTNDPRPEESYQHPRMSRLRDAKSYKYGYSLPHPTVLGPDPQDGRVRRMPEGLVRRSSSQPVRLRENDREKGRGERTRERRRRSLSDERGRGEGSRHRKGQNKTRTVLTLLGIAAGGLAVSAAIGVIDRKRDEGANLRRDERGRSGGSRRDQRAEGSRTKGGGGRK